MHAPLEIRALDLSFPHKVCFEGFSARVTYGERIAIIGRNGSGKSSLLRMIVKENPQLSAAYVPQIVEDFPELSGGQRFNKVLSLALGENPSALFLDEPTNHLDGHNRRSLMRMLLAYRGTLLVVSHDRELLRSCVHTLWHIDNGKITVFRGNFDDYHRETQRKRQALLRQVVMLKHEKNSLHTNRMKEEKRVAQSRASGKKKVANKRWMKSVADIKGMRAEKSQGEKRRALEEKRLDLVEQLRQHVPPEIIVPKFGLPCQENSRRDLVTITEGSVGYAGKLVLRDVSFSIAPQERVAIVGRNGCGKTTLVRAILGDKSIVRSGNWSVPACEDIGFLDQHYSNLDSEKSAMEIISEAVPSWSFSEIRDHLNAFLLRKNAEVSLAVKNLSGGEKARLSLAKIAATPPRLLILDEITNNIDLETRVHIAEILREYPSGLLLISHDEDFLDEIGVRRVVL